MSTHGKKSEWSSHCATPLDEMSTRSQRGSKVVTTVHRWAKEERDRCTREPVFLAGVKSVLTLSVVMVIDSK